MLLEDEVVKKRNEELLKKELSKPKPKQDTVKELIKRILKSQRNLVLQGTRPEDILSQYPHLRKANYVRCDCFPNPSPSPSPSLKTWSGLSLYVYSPCPGIDLAVLRRRPPQLAALD